MTECFNFDTVMSNHIVTVNRSVTECTGRHMYELWFLNYYSIKISNSCITCYNLGEGEH